MTNNIRRHKILILLTIVLSYEAAYSQVVKNYQFTESAYLNKSSRLLGNSVTDLVYGNSNTLWIGTGKGLNSTADNGLSFDEYIPDEFEIGIGGVSALAVLGDIVIVANAFDDPDVDESNATGSGLAISTDNGFSWTHIDQPKDSNDAVFELIYGDTIDALPIVIDVDNVTFDIAITGDSTIYITSFAGGSRKSTDLGETWSRIVLPPDDLDSLTALSDSSDLEFDLSPVDNGNFGVTGNLNHRPFSVIAWGDTVIIGTAGGINRSYDGGVSWFKSNTGNSGISGNWAVVLYRHVWEGNETLLAATRPTVEGEFMGISVSRDGGVSWRTVLSDERVWNFSSDDSVIYAVADSGLFKSVDGGVTWASFPPIIDETTGNPLYTETFYSVIKTPDDRLWAGTADGLIYTDDNSSSWTILRAVKPLTEDGSVRTYSYPNPFSPSRHNTLGGDGHVRFHYSLTVASTISISIYDFSMTLVADAVKNVSRSAGEWDEVWNGRNGFGSVVANGTYFYKIIVNKSPGGEEVHWGKVMVIE